MGRAAFFIPIALTFAASAAAPASAKTATFLFGKSANAPAATAPAASGPAVSAPAVTAPTAAAAVAQAAAPANVNSAISYWRTLRQGGNYSFADYARFLNYNRGWPAEASLRRSAERAMRPGEDAALVLGFYSVQKPQSGNGWARYADALAASNRTTEAVAAAKEAWASADLSGSDESALLARFGGYFTPQEHNRRVDSLLFDKNHASAHRLLRYTSADRQPAFTARVAMQARWPDAETRYRAAAHRISSDSGLLMDRLRYLRDGGNEQAARSLAAQPHQFTERPADPERWYEMLLILANGAADDRQYQLAYNIARQIDDAFPQGTQMSEQAYGVRDHYTSLAWLSGRIALDRLRNPQNAVAMFYRYAYGGKSLQVASKGFYWAGRAALASGRPADANSYFQRAAAYPELFYGQLALERLGRAVPAPGFTPPVAAGDPARAAFARNSLVQATRQLMYGGRADEQMQFIRALSEALDTQAERSLAIELSRQLGRPDLAVWIARSARNDGTAFYVRDAFPTLGSSPRGPWALSHGVARQESSFDRNAVSHAGARGLMQLMPGTAREQAGKLGLAYSPSRVHDPEFNIALGSAYLQRMVSSWDGYVPLAVASYNAGPGNARKWVNAYGDPRSGRVDILGWIESIPFMETRGYVQRVIENAVVYETLNPQRPAQSSLHVSRYLGKSQPG